MSLFDILFGESEQEKYLREQRERADQLRPQLDKLASDFPNGYHYLLKEMSCGTEYESDVQLILSCESMIAYYEYCFIRDGKFPSIHVPGLIDRDFDIFERQCADNCIRIGSVHNICGPQYRYTFNIDKAKQLIEDLKTSRQREAQYQELKEAQEKKRKIINRIRERYESEIDDAFKNRDFSKPLLAIGMPRTFSNMICIKFVDSKAEDDIEYRFYLHYSYIVFFDALHVDNLTLVEKVYDAFYAYYKDHIKV